MSVRILNNVGNGRMKRQLRIKSIKALASLTHWTSFRHIASCVEDQHGRKVGVRYLYKLVRAYEEAKA